MKNTKLKEIKVLDKKYNVLTEYKQEISRVTGILFSVKEFNSMFNRVINYNEILKKEKEDSEVLINEAYETTYIVNMIVKSYLMYLMSHIESKLRTFITKNFVDVLEKENPNTLLIDIKDENILHFFKSKSKFNDVKNTYKFKNINTANKNPREFFHNFTFGGYAFILTRMNEKLILDFFSSNESLLENNTVYNHITGESKREKKINTFIKALKVTKEFRNHITHKTLVMDPLLIETISNNERPNFHLKDMQTKSSYIYDSIDLVLADMGYNDSKARLSRHIDRELKDKNKVRQKKNISAKLSIANIDVSGFYQKK